jgi:hypothetical protein
MFMADALAGVDLCQSNLRKHRSPGIIGFQHVVPLDPELTVEVVGQDRPRGGYPFDL